MSRISGKEIFGEGARIGQPWNPAIHYSLVNLRRYIFIYLSSQSIDIKIYFVSGKIWTIIGNNPFTIYCFYLKQSQVNVTITILWWKINVFQLPSGFTIHKECSKVTPTGGYAATHHPFKKKNTFFWWQFVEVVSLRQKGYPNFRIIMNIVSGWWGPTYPSEKSWSVRQLGWWHSQYIGKQKMFQTTNQVYSYILYIYI